MIKKLVLEFLFIFSRILLTVCLFLPAAVTSYPVVKISVSSVITWEVFGFWLVFSPRVALRLGALCFTLGLCLIAGILMRRWLYFILGGVVCLFLLPVFFFGILFPFEESPEKVIPIAFYLSASLLAKGTVAYAAGRFLYALWRHFNAPHSPGAQNDSDPTGQT